MADRIDTVDGRSKLKPRRSPYWHKVANGCHLGYRRLTVTSAGSWLARSYDPGTRKQTVRALKGTFTDLPESQRFDAARREAEAWFRHLGAGGSTAPITVKSACEDYVRYTRERHGDARADDIEPRFKRWVYGEKFATIELQKLTRRDVETWRASLVKADITDAYGATRKRATRTVNRDITPVRAALNHAHDHAQVTSDMAWRVALRSETTTGKSRDIYLPGTDRRKLIDAADEHLGRFMHGLALVPLRPGALANLTVGQYDPRLRVLTVGKDKAGRDRRITLPPATAELFAAQCEGRQTSDIMFTRSGGQRWIKDMWKRGVKSAAASAGLSDPVVLYALRHSAITDLVVAGLDLMTVATLSGTSVRMIEQHYGHLRADHAASALATLAI